MRLARVIGGAGALMFLNANGVRFVRIIAPAVMLGLIFRMITPAVGLIGGVKMGSRAGRMINNTFACLSPSGMGATPFSRSDSLV